MYMNDLIFVNRTGCIEVVIYTFQVPLPRDKAQYLLLIKAYQWKRKTLANVLWCNQHPDYFYRILLKDVYIVSYIVSFKFYSDSHSYSCMKHIGYKRATGIRKNYIEIICVMFPQLA